MGNPERTNTTHHNVEFTKSQFTVHKFSEEITEKKVIFTIIKMVDSLFIYINDKDRPLFNDLSMAMTNRLNNSPTGTSLLGNSLEDISKNMACRITKKVNKPVYLSYNLEQDRLLAPLIEKRLYEEIKANSDKF